MGNFVSSTSEGDHEPLVEVRSRMIPNIQANARYRAALLSMQQHPEIREILLGFCAKHLALSLVLGVRKDVSMAIKLGLNLLTTVLECAGYYDINSIFEAYYVALQLYCDEGYDNSQRMVSDRDRSNPVVKHILRGLHKDHCAFEAHQKVCEENTFLKFYETIENKLAKNKGLKLLSYFQNKTLSSLNYHLIDRRVDAYLQMKFFKYYFEDVPKEKACAFEIACKQVFQHHLSALSDAKHQALFQALQQGSEEFSECVSDIDHHEGLRLSAKEINRYFTVFEHEGSETYYAEPLHHITGDSETLLSWAIKYSLSHYRKEILGLLCLKGADINQVSNTHTKNTPLHEAITHNNWTAADFLIKNVKTLEAMRKREKREKSKEIDRVKQLEQREKFKHTKDFKHIKKLKKLREKQEEELKEIEKIECKTNRLAQDVKGRTPLSALVDRIDERFNKQKGSEGYTEGDGMFLKNLYAVMKNLISRETVNQKDAIRKYDGKQVYTSIAIEGATPFLKFMIYSFRAFSESDNRLSKAPSFNEFLTLFMNHGVDFRATDIVGNTLLHYLVQERQCYTHGLITDQRAIEWAQFLNDYNISWVIRNVRKESPEDIARSSGRPTLREAIKILNEKKMLQQAATYALQNAHLCRR